MKMLGIIKELNKEAGFGYIKSFDGSFYLFYTNSINNLEKIKNGILVKFDPIFEQNNLATKIELIREI